MMSIYKSIDLKHQFIPSFEEWKENRNKIKGHFDSYCGMLIEEDILLIPQYIRFNCININNSYFQQEEIKFRINLIINEINKYKTPEPDKILSIAYSFHSLELLNYVEYRYKRSLHDIIIDTEESETYFYIFLLYLPKYINNDSMIIFKTILDIPSSIESVESKIKSIYYRDNLMYIPFIIEMFKYYNNSHIDIPFIVIYSLSHDDPNKTIYNYLLSQDNILTQIKDHDNIFSYNGISDNNKIYILEKLLQKNIIKINEIWYEICYGTYYGTSKENKQDEKYRYILIKYLPNFIKYQCEKNSHLYNRINDIIIELKKYLLMISKVRISLHRKKIDKVSFDVIRSFIYYDGILISPNKKFKK